MLNLKIERAGLIIGTSLLRLGRCQQTLTTANASRVRIPVSMAPGSTFVNSSNYNVSSSRPTGGISIQVGIGVGAGLLVIIILVFLALYLRGKRNRLMIERAAAMNLAGDLGVDSCKDREEENPAAVVNRSYEGVQIIRSETTTRRAVSVSLEDNLDVDSCQDERNASPAVIANRVYEDAQDMRNERVLEIAGSVNSSEYLTIDFRQKEDNAKPAVIANKIYESSKCVQPKRKHEHHYEEVKLNINSGLK